MNPDSIIVNLCPEHRPAHAPRTSEAVRRTVIIALQDRLADRRGYLARIPDVTALHDPCCATARSRQEDFADQRLALLEEIDVIVQALADFGVTVDRKA